MTVIQAVSKAKGYSPGASTLSEVASLDAQLIQDYNILEAKLNANRTRITGDPRVSGVGIYFDHGSHQYVIRIGTISKIDQKTTRKWGSKLGPKIKLKISYQEPFHCLAVRSRYRSSTQASEASAFMQKNVK